MSKGNEHRDPDVTLQKLRTRVSGGGRRPLEGLGVDEMVAARELISKGEAEIASYSCRLFLIAKLPDEPNRLGGLLAETKRFLRKL